MNLIEIALFTLMGIACGVASGLTPGIHVNTLAAFMLTLMPVFAAYSVIAVAAAFISMAVVNALLSFIPSILLGAPDSETVLSVLPGHRMLLDGEAMEALKLTGIGGLISLIVVLITFPISIIALPSLFPFLNGNMHYILLFVTLVGIGFEERPFYATGIFLLTGIFGLITLNGFDAGIIFPALSGLFGVSTLLLSLESGINVPLQTKSKITLGKGILIKNSLLGSFAGAVVGFLPGIGAAQATFLVQQANPDSTGKEFLVSNAAVDVGNVIFPLFVLYSLGKTRSGIAIATQEVVGILNLNHLIILLVVALISGVVAFALHIKIGQIFTNFLINREQGNYKKITAGVIIFIAAMVFALTGLNGIIILIAGTLLGLLPPLAGVRRAQCMGYFVLPTMLYYAGLSMLALKIIY